MLREQRLRPELAIPHRRAGRQPSAAYDTPFVTSAITARIAARRLRYALGFGKRTPWAAKNASGLISATLVVATRMGGKISPSNGTGLERFDFGIGHPPHSVGLGLKLPIGTALWLIGMDDWIRKTILPRPPKIPPDNAAKRDAGAFLCG
jgi:hypothetical protein